MSVFPNEYAFIRSQLNTIASFPISYPDDYQPPLQQYSRRIAVLPVALPPLPSPKPKIHSSSIDSVTITFKSAKPPISFPLTVSTTDTINNIKQQLAAQPRAPPADIQRLLLKGKVLVDTKLLKEYPIADGAIVNLMVKPGSHWDGSDTAVAVLVPTPMSTDATTVAPATDTIPSLVISPLPNASGSPSARTSPIPIELDGAYDQVSRYAPEVSSFHATISSPGFWDRLHLFLRTEFANRDDAGAAFEQFLVASKGSLTVGEIARIRDQVGVVGMAGT